MNRTVQHLHTPNEHLSVRLALRRQRVFVACLTLVALTLCVSVESFAQQKMSRSYPVRRNVRLQLSNRSGTIEVEGWDRNDIKVTASMESPTARFTPTLNDDVLLIDVVHDNMGREDIGDVNFRIQVPYTSTVDLETRRGNISVRNVGGSLVRAHVTTEGDIELTGLRAERVMAENIMGNILFDAELMRGGTYELKSTQGDINIHISAGSGFMLTATAPRTRSINLGGFAGMGSFDFQSGNRKVVGKVGEGGATLNTTNLRGSIALFPR